MVYGLSVFEQFAIWGVLGVADLGFTLCFVPSPSDLTRR